MRTWCAAALLLGVTLTACKKDECAAAEAQINVQLAGIDPSVVASVDVTLVVNSGQPITHTFSTPTPAFIFQLKDNDQPPRSVSIRVTAHSSAGKVAGAGEKSATFASNACTFITVVVKPDAVDAGPPPDRAFADGRAADQTKPDASKPDGPAGKCSDGVKNGTEECDGNDLGAKTCATLGFAGGTIRCTADCKISGCTTAGYITVTAGTFMMGSPASEPCRDSSEDQHQVTLTHSFEISDHEVTQDEFNPLMGYIPYSCGSGCPVGAVSWHEAAAYCNALTAQRGLTACYSCTGSGASVACQEAPAYTGDQIYRCPGYRLPTEAEWEYAYRAGTTTAYYNAANSATTCGTCSDANADAIAWYSCNAGLMLHPVKLKKPNAWGLYDMAGNVWEWCHDWWQDSLGLSSVTDPIGSGSSDRVMRGGGASHGAPALRAASRNKFPPASKFAGFRCSRGLQ